ncbi:putative aminopeptidase NPEPL1 isoform X2 [Lampetra fluviatilis]
MAGVSLEFVASAGASDPQERPVVFLGQLQNLQKLAWAQIRGKLEPRVPEETWQAALGSLNPNPSDSCSLWLNNATVAALPSRVSRHNSPSAATFIPRLLRSGLPGGVSQCIVCLTSLAEGVRLAARIVDMPCSEMNTDHFLEEIAVVGKELGLTPTVIRGEELKERGFGGIYGVGKAACNPPALAVLSHKPEGATQTIAWVGKGIVYDTGGLSMKGKTAMPGMKRDCGGAAAVLGAFRAAVKQGFCENLHAVFCLAENAVGPNATRPDDIHRLYSGKTVEINNTDAEGRLVLSDGVVFASRDLEADIILDMATLTGAQGIATGKHHAAVLTNRAEWELACCVAGRRSGDLAHPLVYCPELHFSEFSSSVADMKNSVADRGNAQSSCAGLFIAAHLGFDWPGVWVHVDIASPVHVGERATGFGVALLLSLFGSASDDPLLQLASPLGAEQPGQTPPPPSSANAAATNQSKRRRLV